MKMEQENEQVYLNNLISVGLNVTLMVDFYHNKDG